MKADGRTKWTSGWSFLPKNVRFDNPGYIEASEASMAQISLIRQTPPMAQALPVAQTTHANVSACNVDEPKFIMLEKFNGTRSKFCGFVQQVNLFLRLHPSRYPDDSTQVAFIGSLLSGNALFWFAPFLEKHLPVLQDMVQFEALFTDAFGDSDREKVADGKFAPKNTVCCNLYSRISITCDLEWNDKAFINRFLYGLKDDVKDLLITMLKVETLQEFITQAITCDNRLFERRQEKRFGWGNANHTIISTSSIVEKKCIRLRTYAD
jgi:hypothetical protein